MATTIYLIRHAEAEGNLYRRIQGHWDGRITPRGRAQIDELAERFIYIRLSAVYSSDLQRKIFTAGPGNWDFYDGAKTIILRFRCNSYTIPGHFNGVLLRAAPR